MANELTIVYITLGCVLGVVAATVYGLKYTILMDQKIERMVEKVERLEAESMKLRHRLENEVLTVLKQVTKKKSRK